jgi:WD40 repeat protein
MSTTSNCLKARSQITNFTLYNDNIFYSTEFHGLKVLSKDNCNDLLSFTHEFLNHETTAVAFSPNGLYCAFCTANRVYIVNLQDKTLLKCITSIEQTIISLYFDLSSNYIIVGTKKGRILQFKYNQSTLLARVISYKYKKMNNMHGNILTAISFYKEYLISAYYDGTIEITNLYTKVHFKSLKHSNASIHIALMLDDNRLVSATSNGRVHLQNLNSTKAVQEINTPFTSISQIILMPKTNYLLVSSYSNTIALINLKKAKIEHTKFIVLKEDIYTVALLDENTLAVVLKDNSIVKVGIPSADDLKSHILHNSLDKAYALIESNHMLYDTPEYHILQTQYKKIYLNAVEALINQNKNAALILTNIFKDTPAKKEEIQLLYRAFENYQRFVGLYLDKKYALAYHISAKFPALQLTHQYRQMEKIFKDIFLNAQRHILLGNRGSAAALLNEYITVASKRDLIKLILDNNKVFVEFLKVTQEKNFTKVNELAKQYPLLSKIPTYKILEDSMDSYLYDIELHIKKGEVKEAKTAIKNLQTNSSRIETLKNKLYHYEKLQDVYKNDDFKACYETLDSYTHLNGTDLGEMLNKHWIKIIQKCEEFALNGNIKGIKITLKELMSIESRKGKVGDLLRVSFHVKIKQLLATSKFKSAQNIIYSYLDIFGNDNEIDYIMKQYEKISNQKLAITQNVKTSRHSWLNSEIIMK